MRAGQDNIRFGSIVIYAVSRHSHDFLSELNVSGGIDSVTKHLRKKMPLASSEAMK
jgi:hypothetical protein